MLNESFNEHFPPNQEQLHNIQEDEEKKVLKGEITFLNIELKKKQVMIDRKNIAFNLKIVEVERLKMEKQDYEKEIHKLKEEVKNQKENRDSMEKEKQNYQNKVKSLENDKSNYSACIRGLRRDIKETKSTAIESKDSDSRKKISDLQRQLRKCREENRTLMANLEDIQNTVDTADAEESDVKVNKKLAEKSKEVNKLKSEVKSVEKRNKEFVNLTSDLNKRITDLQIENITLKATKKRIEEVDIVANIPQDKASSKGSEKENLTANKTTKEKVNDVPPHSSGIICKWENTKLCYLKNKCKDIHPKSTCPSHSKYGKCQAPAECPHRHPDVLCRANKCNKFLWQARVSE